MKRHVFLLAVAVLCFASINAWSQIYVEFLAPMKMGNRPYRPLPASAVEHKRAEFVTPPNQDPDDGFKAVELPFTFDYNNGRYNWIGINVNGFVMLLPDGNVPIGTVGSNIQTRLFESGQQFPRNVIAPYWGDHFYRDRTIPSDANGNFMSSSIWTSTVQVGGRTAFCVEWRNLNINDKTIPSSVGNFQLYIYRQDSVVGSFQGDIEFAYGQIGGNPFTNLQTVITRNATVGLKGSTSAGDWVNGLAFANNDSARLSRRVTNQWQPSGGSDTIITLVALPRLRLDIWGDGDADMSQAPGARHAGQAQNRFVTAADAFTVLRSSATNIPLDSLYRRNAYKADVDHNGRFWYSTRNLANTADSIVGGRPVVWRREVRFRTPSNNHLLDLPADNSRDADINTAVYFQVNALDAALIMHYLGGRLVTLPYTLDSIPPIGKITTSKATDVVLNEVISFGKNTYRVPVYANGTIASLGSAVFSINGDVLNVELNPSFNKSEVMVVTNNNRIAIAGSINVDETTPLAYVTVSTNDDKVTLSDIEFNGVKTTSNPTIAVQKDNQTNGVVASPNPFTNTVNISFTPFETGIYAINIYDVLGNKVATLNNSELAKGAPYTFQWTANETNPNGVYVYRIEGNGVTHSNNVVLTR